MLSSIQCCVADREGTVTTLALYNFIPLTKNSLDASELFPIGTRFGIKHPYLKVAIHGNICLRVDNPCNVIVDRSLLREEEKGSLSASQLKASGIAKAEAGHHVQAVVDYSQALTAARRLRVDLLSNRALAFLRLKDYRRALADSEAVLALNPVHAKALHHRDVALREVTPTSAAETTTVAEEEESTGASIDPNRTAEQLKLDGNTKFKAKDFREAAAMYSAALTVCNGLREMLVSNRASAHLHLLNHEAAMTDCEEVLLLNPTHRKTMSLLERAQRAREVAQAQRQGRYDFVHLPWWPEQQHHVENFFGPIEVRPAGKKGRGLFVTRAVRAGELLFAEKAIAWCYPSKENQFMLALNVEANRLTDGSQHTMISDLVRRAHSDPTTNRLLSLLIRDKARPNTTLPDMGYFRSLSCYAAPSSSSSFSSSLGKNIAAPLLSASQIAGCVGLNSASLESTKQQKRRGNRWQNP
jgi:tetratricopeptide (TPR) repeat protein